MSAPNDPIDPVLAKRAQVLAWSGHAKRAGYLAILVALIVFVIGALTNFGPAVTAVIIGAIVVSAILLIPAMIFGYGAKAAEREEAGEPFRY